MPIEIYENAMNLLVRGSLASKTILAAHYKDLSSRQLRKLHLRNLLNFLWLALNAFKYFGFVLICLDVDARRKASILMALSDMSLNFGEQMRPAMLVCFLSVTIALTAISAQFLFSRHVRNWYEVLAVLTGKLNPVAIGLTENSELTNRFLVLSRKVCKLTAFVMRSYQVMSALFAISPSILLFIRNLKNTSNDTSNQDHYLLNNFLLALFWLPGQLVNAHWTFIGAYVFFTPFAYFCVCLLSIRYRSLKFRQLLSFLLKDRVLLRGKMLTRLLEDHNRMVKQLVNYNKFWRQVYFVSYACLLLFNLSLTHVALFGHLDNQLLRAVAVFGSAASFGFLVVIAFSVAQLPAEIHRAYPLLCSVAVGYEGWNISTAMKLTVTLEQLSEPIGFTFGNLFTLTTFQFAKVSAILFLNTTYLKNLIRIPNNKIIIPINKQLF